MFATTLAAILVWQVVLDRLIDAEDALSDATRAEAAARGRVAELKTENEGLSRALATASKRYQEDTQALQRGMMAELDPV
jgi:hypothetical protein